MNISFTQIIVVQSMGNTILSHTRAQLDAEKKKNYKLAMTNCDGFLTLYAHVSNDYIVILSFRKTRNDNNWQM